ncbi:hypothetical protein PPYR_03327 [Photinus pyralis]|uniref:WH2 domain-containing protein n=1 Tax=Photinus pyralis TaxID=7054 RepID=A0A1Y1K7G5_PHOPY|nr:DNA ligase 1-like isoform X2 [Photinus pyralis]KAB0791527.1 hypothetical protein PPYR_03327 [Photinus pyralis]
MPIGKGASTEERRGSSTAKRETFRPPWVKEGPDDLRPKPSEFLSKSKQMSKDAAAQKAEAAKKGESQENGGSKESTFVRPQLKPVPPKEQTKLQSREVKVPIKLNSAAERSYPETKPPLKRNSIISEDTEKPRNPIPRQDSLKKVVAPKAPPMPPPAPKLPKATDLKPLSDKQKATIDALKARPKVRPDWTAMLKEVESGPKLKHVQCNDRSKPLLPKTKDDDKSQFIYESEKPEKDDSHNMLLKEIQLGVALKKVKTNDRSKPVLEGLRKFRRQMTIEEQIIKSQSMASIPPEEIADEVDELDDIDKVRDDLQSTKQMLAIELRNKESLARENKRLQTRLAQLEADLEREHSNKKVSESAETDDKMLTTLKSEAADARKTAEDLKQKFHEASNQLDNTKSELEEVRKQKQVLEKKLTETLSGKRVSICERQDSIRRDSESELEVAHDSNDDDEEDEEKKERKMQKEVKQLRNKLRGCKNKEDNAKKERIALKTQGKRLQQAIKDERKKYRGLKKEVHKMAALLKDPDDSDEEEEEADEEEEETQSETESESSESESESEAEKSASEAEDAPVEKKRANLTKRTKRYEGRLTALKKANYLLKTNVERLQDDLNKAKEESSSLQQELDSVLAELG